MRDASAMSQGGMSLVASFDGGIGSGIFTMMLSLFMIFICILTVFFSNKFFLMSKTHDIGVMMISGSSIIRIAKFLIVQNFMIMGIAAPLGALAGCCVFPLVNHVIYLSMNIQAPVFTFVLANLEVTTGIHLLALKPFITPQIQYALIAAATSFGGLCTMAQVQTVLSATDLSLKRYIVIKTGTAFVSFLLCLILLC